MNLMSLNIRGMGLIEPFKFDWLKRLKVENNTRFVLFRNLDCLLFLITLETGGVTLSWKLGFWLGFLMP